MRTALVSIALLALATAACEPARRDVQVNWTFGTTNLSCSAAGVATIEVDIAGEFLTPNQFPCTDSSGNVNTGVDLGRFLTGNYEIEITGSDSSGNITYQDDEIIGVVSSQNPNVFNLNVPVFNPSTAPSGQGNLILLWTFGGKSCAAAGITSVQITIDGMPIVDGRGNSSLSCTSQGTDGIEIGPLDSGSRAVVVEGLVGTSIDYSSSFNATISANHDTQLTEDITALSVAPNTSTAIVNWSFAGMDCSDALVDSVHVFVDGTDTATLPCVSSTASDSGQVTGITAGSHVINISAVRGTGSTAQLVYESTGTSANPFQAGTATVLIINAPSTSPGVGGATLTFAFPAGGPDCTSTAASTSVSYTLTSPAGVAQTAATATCGGASGNTSISICDPGAAGCGGGNSGLTAGVWTISASASSGGTTYTAAGPVSVPNNAVGTATLTFAGP